MLSPPPLPPPPPPLRRDDTPSTPTAAAALSPPCCRPCCRHHRHRCPAAAAAPQEEDLSLRPILNYWKPNLTLSLVDHFLVYAKPAAVPPTVASHLSYSDAGGYHPVAHFSEFWLLKV